MQQKLSNKLFFCAAIGAMVEYYDYSMFALLLPFIAPLFFPEISIYDSLFQGYCALFIAKMARPLGGLFFGYIGDMAGRRQALLYSMIGIAVSTLLIGLIPPHTSIGVYAGILLMLTKAVQMFCFGGEYNGAGIYLVEHAQGKNESLIGGLLGATMLAGGLLASVIGFVATLEGMPLESWRLAFLLGGCMSFLAVIYRKNLKESPAFSHISPKNDISTMVKTYPHQLLAGFFVGGFSGMPLITVITFINPVLMTQGFLSGRTLILLQSLLMMIAIMILVIAGKIADKYSAEKVMLSGAFMLIFLAFPLLWIMDFNFISFTIIAQILLIIINEIFLAPSNTFLKNLFPMQYRYRGVSLSFTLGLSIIGGLTPVIENCLYRFTNNFSSIAIWLILISVGTFMSMRSAIRARV